MDRNHQAIVITLVIGLLIGFLLGRVTLPDSTNDTEETGEVLEETDTSLDTMSESEEARPVLVAQGDIVNVKDQKAGAEVFLSRVELMQDGWVAIREEQGDDLGTILGARRFDAGVHQGVVSLLRETEAGSTYSAVLYADDGDKVFDFEKDAIIIDTDGVPVLMIFETY